MPEPRDHDPLRNLIAESASHHRGGTAQLGALGILGLLLDWKVGLHEIVTTFAGCETAWDVLRTLDRLEETMFLGLVVWLLLLLASLSLLGVVAVRMVSAAARWLSRWAPTRADGA